MIRAIIVVRESGKLNPDFSLDFDFPEVPRIGDYISIQRPDKLAPFGEDMIVRNIWWRLNHPEVGGITNADDKMVGSVGEVMVECDPAISPYSSKSWKVSLERKIEEGTCERFNVARVQFPEGDVSILP